MKRKHNKRLSPSSSPSFTNTILKTAKPAAYFALLLLTYTLGYLSHNSNLDSFQVKTQCANPIPPENTRKTLIDHIFNGTSPFTDFPPPHAADKLYRSKKVKGWGSNNAVFENLIHKVKPEIIVEVGTFLGASALHMAKLTQRLGLKTQIYCIDDFRGWAGFREQFKNIVVNKLLIDLSIL
ncbi:S-adenosyl-L-methionine-dependent methyltransferase domain-containing protein [Trifolium pratense]|uniref:S-adenosyl-L-methionine-dependent methyltransferase domain-containing protein n=2 Tax=Trifolium pratense TaxID=57577 RepID=A0A2K3KZK4_TRIPR|nr:S-adenosyl-L-methionine-dependent methyltransferase domain-containing protein [Trifolium pratense]